MNDCDCEFAFSSNPKGILFENPRSRYASGRETPMSGKAKTQNPDKHSARNNRKKKQGNFKRERGSFSFGTFDVFFLCKDVRSGVSSPQRQWGVARS